MKPEQWSQVEQLYHAALEHAPNERAAYLEQACAGDAALRREVESLLGYDAQAADFIEQPAVAFAAEDLADEQSTMQLGQHISHYQILSRLGAGGMGEVFLAQDTTLNRHVALKLLPKQFTIVTERVQRFEREARAASALNHPNILTIHEIGRTDDTHFIVTEYVEGQTLRQRMKTARMSLPDALDVAIQIANALAAAHEAGIVHRDIKPENVMIRNDGIVKVLDFGLAKLTERKREGEKKREEDSSTATGIVMGTPRYMSPEQARGEKVDARSDIFSFGVMLYEMLAGAAPFAGKTNTDVILAIIEKEPPPLSHYSPAIPETLEWLVSKALTKEREERYQTAREMLVDLKRIQHKLVSERVPSIARTSSAEAQPATQPLPVIKTNKQMLFWAGSIVALLLLVAIALFVYSRRAPSNGETVRFSIPLPDKATNFASPAISPDGRHLVFTGLTEGKALLWVRTLDALEAKALPGTEGARFPFWSPDSQHIAYFAQNTLKRVALSGGSPTTICDALGIQGQGTTWGRDGTILFLSGEYGLYRVSAQGGAAEKLPFYLGWADHPTLLPDGRHFLYAKAGAQEGSGIYLASIDGRENKRLLPADYSRTAYAVSPEGKEYILFVREAALLAQPFDATAQQLTGDPIRLADHVTTGSVSVSENGVLVYRTADGTSQQQLSWVDRTGKKLGTVGSPTTIKGAAGIFNPALSPDETRVAVTRSDPQTMNRDVWLLDVARGAESRFTFGHAFNSTAVWSPDGSRIVWGANREKDTKGDLYIKSSGGGGQDELLLKSDYWKVAHDWSKDGNLLFMELNPQTKYDLWILPMEGDRKPYPYIQTPFTEVQGRFSPDGKWISYLSDESGRMELYVQAFPANGTKHHISTDGVASAGTWGRDGKELFYIAPDGKMMAVAVKTGTTFAASTPKSLFDHNSVQGIPDYFSVTHDGQRFLLRTNVGTPIPQPFTVVLNWPSLLPNSR